MDPKVIHASLLSLRQEIGGDAILIVRVDSDGDLAHGSLYPNGICEDPSFHVRSETFAGVLDALRAEWVGYCGQHEADTIKKMALTIIRITSERSRCVDGDLRAEGFDAATVVRWGALACAKADEMAGNGPFSIITIQNANAV